MPKQVVNLSDTVSLFRDKVNIISNDVGWRGNLTTTQDSDIIGAINEHDAELGTITALAMGTTASTVSGAISELEGEIDTLNTFVDPGQALTTTATTLADAINEIDAELGVITAGAMGTTAATVSGAILELQTEILLIDSGASSQLTSIGTLASLNTTAKNTIVAAINELDGRIDTDLDFRNKVSATDAGGDGSFAYNQSTGVFTYTGPSASETRNHFSGGNEITITGGSIAHDNITRTDTTSTDAPAYGGTFDAVTGITTNTRGHVTAIDVSTITIPASDNTDTIYTLPEATATERGGIELFSNTDQSVAANAVTATASRTYGLQLNSNGQAVINVPWVDTDTVYTHPNHSGDVTSTADGATAITNDAVSRAKLKDEVSLVIKNSAGTALKTLYGAGS